MSLLYYWRPDNHYRDRSFGFGYHLNQGSSALAAAMPGDSVWAITRRKRDGLYVLAAELVVRAVTHNPPNYRYGAYRVWGDLERSRYFDTDAAPNSEPLVRALGITARSRHLGQSFQGYAAVRKISATDHSLLAAFADSLVVLERVGIYPEDEFEARLYYGQGARPLLLRETREAYSERTAYLYTSVDVQRARRHIQQLQDLYGGRCQLCMFDPYGRFGFRLCHGHHIQWLSRGGEDTLENLVLICPNHHAAVHHDDAAFDYSTLSFTFSKASAQALKLNIHLPRAS
jgi:5-methylcytosine-specific restriction enzyme A